MKKSFDKKYLYWGMTIFFTLVAGILFYYLLFHGSNIKLAFHRITTIAMPIICGFVFAFLLTPIVNFFERKILIPLFKKLKFKVTTRVKKFTRMIAITITYIIVFFALYGFFSLVIPQLIRSIQSIILQFPIYVTNLEAWIVQTLANNENIEKLATNLLNQYSGELERWLNQTLLPQINEILKTVSLSLLNFFVTLWNFIIGFIISVYILVSKEKFAAQGKKIIYALLEQSTANNFINNLRFTSNTFLGFINGKIIDSIIIGFICYAGTNLMNTPYPVLVSVIVGITNIIPFFGPYLGAIPSSILILMVDPLRCLYFIIFIIILQQFDGNILGPKILGDSTGLSAFWVIFSITIFGGLFGLFGMIIGVPVFAVIYAAIQAYLSRKLNQKGLPTTTDVYYDLEAIDNNQFIALSAVNKPEVSRRGDKVAVRDYKNSTIEKLNTRQNTEEMLDPNNDNKKNHNLNKNNKK